VRVIGVCNGFQILLEAGLLPGALMRNASLKFVCREVKLEVTNANTVFTRGYSQGQVIRCPVAHHDGNYFTDPDTLEALNASGQMRSATPPAPIRTARSRISPASSTKAGNVLGMMPHPENLIEDAHGGADGRALFESALGLVDA
jgi:phosphoribosylformylglycinamidine (FGAM) synthase-like amidotransferase family enzyme